MELMSQPVLSEGLVFGKCGTTDIDLSCDWQGRTFVFVELKYGSTPLPAGQKYHLEAMVKGLNAGGKKAYAILAHHRAPKGEPIVAAESNVTRVYDGVTWKPTNLIETISLKGYMVRLHAEHMERNKK